MKRYLSLWLRFLKTSVIRDMEYAVHFWADVVTEVLWTLVSVFTFQIMFTQTDAIAGWSKWEVILIYAIYRIVSGLYNVLFRQGINSITVMVNNGELDLFLLRPIDSMYLLTTRMVRPSHLSQVILGVLLVGYCFKELNFGVSVGNISLLVGLIMIGLIIRYSIGLLIVLPVFWWEKIENIEQLQLTFLSTARFPRMALPSLIRNLLTFILPILLVAAIPAEIFLGKISLWFTPVILGIALLSLVVIKKFFTVALKSYSSASS